MFRLKFNYTVCWLISFDWIMWNDKRQPGPLNVKTERLIKKKSLVIFKTFLNPFKEFSSDLAPAADRLPPKADESLRSRKDPLPVCFFFCFFDNGSRLKADVDEFFVSFEDLTLPPNFLAVTVSGSWQLTVGEKLPRAPRRGSSCRH